MGLRCSALSFNLFKCKPSECCKSSSPALKWKILCEVSAQSGAVVMMWPQRSTAFVLSQPFLLCPWLMENTPLPVPAQGKRPRIPNVSGWLKKWQLLLHLECPPPHFSKCWKGRSDICSGVLLTSPCFLSLCFPPCHPVFPALLWPWIYIGCLSAYQAKHHAVFDIHHLLMGCSLIAAGEYLDSLLSHWRIQGEGPPTEGPHLLSAVRAPLLT